MYRDWIPQQHDTPFPGAGDDPVVLFRYPCGSKLPFHRRPLSRVAGRYLSPEFLLMKDIETDIKNFHLFDQICYRCNLDTCLFAHLVVLADQIDQDVRRCVGRAR